MKIEVSVKPLSKIDTVNQTGPGSFRVTVKAPAAEGRANEALIRLLAAYFSVPKSAVRIVVGRTGRRKLVEILPTARH